MSLYYLFYYFVIYSFIGWCCEVIYAYFRRKMFINRGFLHGPFCPIYGFGSLIIIYSAIPLTYIIPANSVITLIAVFLYTSLVTSVLEYITGAILEKFFHTTWWNYSNRKFNIKGRICAKFSIIWGAAALVLIYIIHPGIVDLVSMIPVQIGIIFAYVGAIYFITDFFLTIRMLINFSSILSELNKISIELKEKMATNLEEIRLANLKKKADLIPLLTFSTNVKKTFNDFSVNKALKRYTTLPNLNLTKEGKAKLRFMRRKRVLSMHKLILRRQKIYEKIAVKNYRLTKAFPNLKFKHFNK